MAAEVPSSASVLGLDALRQLVVDYGVTPDCGSVAICYGSTVRGSHSDLDMLIYEPVAQHEDMTRAFVAGLVALHHQTGRALDTEVPYENKLFYGPEDVAACFELTMFVSSEGEFDIPLLDGLQEDDAYFQSRAMKLRLFLNALTSDNILLAGDTRVYSELSKRAAESLRILIGMLATKAGKVQCDYTEARELLLAQGGANYKDYLGYHPDDQTLSALVAVICGPIGTETPKRLS